MKRLVGKMIIARTRRKILGLHFIVERSKAEEEKNSPVPGNIFADLSASSEKVYSCLYCMLTSRTKIPKRKENGMLKKKAWKTYSDSVKSSASSSASR